LRILPRLAPLFVLVAVLTGCAQVKTAGKVVVTPLTVVRDVVDVPLVSLTNVFELWADRTVPADAPRAGISAGIWGISPYIGYDLSHYFFKGMSWILGAVDYIPCRSIWPNFPKGISPWLKEGEPWGSLYWPNTRTLWASDEPTPAGAEYRKSNLALEEHP
jgi:uncharacterized membrane protein (GlpM family)